MVKGKRVVLINFSLKFGGAERYISQLANFLSRNGVDVFVVLLDNAPLDYVLEKDVTVVTPFKVRPNEKVKKLLYFIYVFFVCQNIFGLISTYFVVWLRGFKILIILKSSSGYHFNNISLNAFISLFKFSFFIFLLLRSIIVGVL